jgi:hypothetical protein
VARRRRRAPAIWSWFPWLVGICAGGAILYTFVFAPQLAVDLSVVDGQSVAWWQAALASLYGAVDEEILLRLGFMTVWSGWARAFRERGRRLRPCTVSQTFSPQCCSGSPPSRDRRAATADPNRWWRGHWCSTAWVASSSVGSTGAKGYWQRCSPASPLISCCTSRGQSSRTGVEPLIWRPAQP